MEGGEAQTAPPVNNLLQPDVYNRLDAQVRERTRVVNSQLDQRLLAQQNILSKYRLASERYYRREKKLVTQELSRISTRLPAVSRIPDFRNKFLYGEGIHGSLSKSLPDVRPAGKKIRGIPEEKPDLPFCQRYFIHHLPTKRKYYKTAPSPPPFLARGGGGGGGEGEGGGAGGGGGGGGGGESEEANVGKVSLPPLKGDEVSSAPKQDVREVRLAPIEAKTQDDSALDGVKSALKNIDRLSPISDRVLSGERDARNGNRSARVSDEGRQSDRTAESGRTLTLPPLASQNVRMAHSSPQLYHG